MSDVKFPNRDPKALYTVGVLKKIIVPIEAPWRKYGLSEDQWGEIGLALYSGMRGSHLERFFDLPRGTLNRYKKRGLLPPNDNVPHITGRPKKDS